MGIFDRLRGVGPEASGEVVKQPEAAGRAQEGEKAKRSQAFRERVKGAEQRIQGIHAKADSARRQMGEMSETLNKIDPDWKQGDSAFNRDSGLEMPDAAKALREKYDQHGKAFDDTLSQLGDANKEHAVAVNHAESFDKHGVDLEVRGKEIEARKMELEQRLRQSDELTEGYGTGTRPKLEEYLALDAESQAIASGTWDKRADGGWLPKEADVPDFMPSFRENQVNSSTGKYETNPKLVAQEIVAEKARAAQEELNVRSGRAPGAF